MGVVTTDAPYLSGVLHKPHGKCEVHVNGHHYAVGVLGGGGGVSDSGCGL